MLRISILKIVIILMSILIIVYNCHSQFVFFFSAHRGYECQGNEFSLFMLLASNFVLNKCKTRNCSTLYPWIHQFTNNFQAEDVVRPALFPDVNPNDLVCILKY